MVARQHAQHILPLRVRAMSPTHCALTFGLYAESSRLEMRSAPDCPAPPLTGLAALTGLDAPGGVDVLGASPPALSPSPSRSWRSNTCNACSML
jgi:hypothetical protein